MISRGDRWDPRDDGPDAKVEPSGATRVIFADPSGRRWRRMRAAGWVVSLALAIAFLVSLPGVLASPELIVGDSDASAAAGLAEERDPPIIGTGPLERVLRVERRDGAVVGVDPFTGEVERRLTANETDHVDASQAVIEHYGYSQTAKRTLSLSFDDGPDAMVTPRLLDVLSQHKVPATFFVVGRNAVRSPEILRRMTREGHAVGVHTMTHPVLSEEPEWRAQAEVVQTGRAIRAITGRRVAMWRGPYTGGAEGGESGATSDLLRAQRLGYTHVVYDFDTQDWFHDAQADESVADIPLPDLSSGENMTILLHDAGGPNRARTVEYVERLISHAGANGYTFHTIPQVNPPVGESNAVIAPDLSDHISYVAARVGFDLPRYVLVGLFGVSILFMVIVGLVNAGLALYRARRRRQAVLPADARSVDTSVVLAAYNEEAVLARTLDAISASTHPVLEIIVVDDGSTDLTADVVRLASKRDPRIVLMSQNNTGKATALNRGVAASRGQVVVTLDADTLVRPTTVLHLVRHFAVDDSGDLGAVAGVVRVGNRRRNLLTRWQALEYLTQIGLDRSAQDALGAISIIPGACAAWRKEAILSVGGYAEDTLAEDCDLALSLHRYGWRVTQDDEALAYTEAPESVDDLLKQRSRWTYGTLQAMYKNRDLFFSRRNGWLGWFVLPNYLLSLLIPLVFLPFIVVMAVVSLQTEGPWVLLTYAGAFLIIHAAFAALTVRLMREDAGHLLMVPIYRLVYEPLRAYLLYTSVLLAIKGGRMAWNKLDRTGAMDAHAADEQPESAVEGSHFYPVAATAVAR